ncbi:MAG: metal-dependent hydrolase [Proteobacteria bacterium]|nr:metal-dependent hydrolase [Pseudomonadota bacterium]
MEIPRHWFGGNAVATHLANGVNLLFPAGERFFVRSVKYYTDRRTGGGDDAAEKDARIRGFFGQEGNHAREHERFFAILEGQGYEIRGFLRRFERVSFGFLERISPPALNLAVTAAAEHYTAIMAEQVLEGDLLDIAHPVMRDLMSWHAAEEIEHKAVAFDVLRQVNPSYLLRVAGMILASLALACWWLIGTRMLLRQDDIDRAEARRIAGQLPVREGGPQIGSNAREIARNVFWKGIRSYLRRDFHPDNNDNYHLAQKYLSRIDDPTIEA